MTSTPTSSRCWRRCGPNPTRPSFGSAGSGDRALPAAGRACGPPFRRPWGGFDDLVQVARIGLVNAVDRFDVERGANFLSFAVPTVMGEVRRHFRDGTWSMRVPRRSKEISLRIGRAADELVQRLGRSPRPSELAEFLDLSVDEVIDGLMARSAYNSISIDAEADEQRQSIGDTLGDDDEHLAAVEDYVTLAPAMARLPERERNILSLRFFRGMSQSEIAAEVGISQMHVSRLLSRTLRACGRS